MAFRLQDFKCTECGNTQEELVETSTDTSKYKAESDCNKCGASNDHMKPSIGLATHGQHVSWSKWRV